MPRKPTAKQIVKAHQFLCYVKSETAWTDYEYDQFCEKHGIPGNGGSSRASDYSAEIQALAGFILLRPSNPLFTHPAK